MLDDAMNISVDIKNLNFFHIDLSLNGTRLQLISTWIDNSTSRLVITPVFFLKTGLTYELTFVYSGLINPTAGGDTGGLFFTTFVDTSGMTK